MTAEELPLEPAPRHLHENNVDEFAAHIAAHAPIDPYIEQKIREYRVAGLDPTEIPTHPLNQTTTETAETAAYRGDAFEGDLHPQYHQPFEEELTPEGRAKVKAAIAQARIAFDPTKDK